MAEFIESNELLHVRISDLPRHHLWTQFARQSNLSAVNVERGLVFDNVMLAVQYALSGEGIALVDTYLYGDYIRTGAWSSRSRIPWMTASAITCSPIRKP